MFAIKKISTGYHSAKHNYGTIVSTQSVVSTLATPSGPLIISLIHLIEWPQHQQCSL